MLYLTTHTTQFYFILHGYTLFATTMRTTPFVGGAIVVTKAVVLGDQTYGNCIVNRTYAYNRNSR